LWAFFLDTLWLRFYQPSVKVHDRCEWLTYVRLLAPSIAAQHFGVGPYRLEGGGTRSGFDVAAEVDEGVHRSVVSEVGAGRRFFAMMNAPSLSRCFVIWHYAESVLVSRYGA